MPNTTANGLQIEYDTFGDKTSPAVLLIAGLSAQMIFWPADFCQKLSDRGFYVVRFDNRDVGLSTKFHEKGIPDMKAAQQGKNFAPPYTLEDMADDAIGLLDALDIQKAHFCGVSMGAMITQIIGYRKPERVLSLISIMGSTGDPGLPPATSEAMEMLIKPAPAEKEPYIAYVVALLKVFWGSLEFDDELVREHAAQTFDRSFYPPGVIRQHAAILASDNRLAAINAPTLVIHGSEDPLLPVDHGIDTAGSIPNARILIIQRMGHCLPKATWPQIIDAIAAHAASAAP